MSTCKGCGKAHDPMIGCSRAARLAAIVLARQSPVLAIAADALVNNPPAMPQPERDSSSYAGKYPGYKDPAAKREYMREYMRDKRAKEKAAKAKLAAKKKPKAPK